MKIELVHSNHNGKVNHQIDGVIDKLIELLL